MPSEMVERVARAICASNDVDFDSVSEQVKQNCRLLDARAAIEAMREPTEAMVAEGLRKPTGMIEWIAAVKVSWQAMIDEALK